MEWGISYWCSLMTDSLTSLQLCSSVRKRKRLKRNQQPAAAGRVGSNGHRTTDVYTLADTRYIQSWRYRHRSFKGNSRAVRVQQQGRTPTSHCRDLSSHLVSTCWRWHWSGCGDRSGDGVGSEIQQEVRVTCVVFNGGSKECFEEGSSTITSGMWSGR